MLKILIVVNEVEDTHMTTKILLCCAAGMSTSLLVTKMQKAAAEKGLDCHIEAVAVESFRDYVQEYDVILLGPQVKYKKAEFTEVANQYGKPVDVIDMVAYGTMNGAKVLDAALKLIK